MTIYDKAFVDEYADKLKTLLLTSIFFSYQKNNNLTVSKNNNKNNTLTKKNNNKKSTKSNSNLKNFFNLNKPKRKNSENNLKIFNMNEYEQMVENSNLLYKQKFKEDRETMFNPKLVIKHTNELLLSTLMKKIAEKQKTRQTSFIYETRTNINNQNKKYESLNSLDNSYLKEKKFKLNKRMSKIKNAIYIDEQKNPELDYEHNDLSKIKTPFKYKNNIILDNNKKDINKRILVRRFSAMP